MPTIFVKMPCVPNILLGVAGAEGKNNDVIFCGTLTEKRPNVIFFGGDIQNFEHIMRQHRNDKQFCEWSLDNVAKILAKRFPSSNIWIIKPSKMIDETISVFENFVRSDNSGIPTYKSDYGAIKHLFTLLQNCACDNMLSETDEKHSGSCPKRDFSLTDNATIFVGFSKGCVVLNQIIHELSGDDNRKFVSGFKEFYWLDGGHQGNHGTWVTDENVLGHLSRLDVKIEVHVTPYQVKDKSRPWIGEEEVVFAEILKKTCRDFTEKLHFENQKHSLSNHFKLLVTF